MIVPEPLLSSSPFALELQSTEDESEEDSLHLVPTQLCLITSHGLDYREKGGIDYKLILSCKVFTNGKMSLQDKPCDDPRRSLSGRKLF
jgi:hypothetical protein